MNTTPPARSVALFFALAFALGIPFWLLGAATGVELLPGLPIAALAAFCPALAAAILIHRQAGAAGTAALLKRCFDYRRIPSRASYLVLLLFMPAVMALSFFVMRFSGTAVPTPHFAAVTAVVLFLAFFIGALGEELGWSGYALDPMQARWGAARAALVLGLVWAVFHFIGLLQAHRSPEWIAWWSLYTIAGRLILVWYYNNTGKSVFAASLFHATINVTWQLFPVNGSYFDLHVTGLILAGAALIILVLWGPRTLAAFRFA